MLVKNAAARAALEDLQQALQRAQAPAWLLIGDAMARLDQLEETAEDGKPWTEILRDFLVTLPATDPVSAGHLNKVRRVRGFVRTTMKRDGGPYTDQELSGAQFSALEVADRLHSLDADQGTQALYDCVIHQRPFAEMRRTYEAYISAHSDKIPAKRATWLRKRQEGVSPTPPQDDGVEKALLSDPRRFFGVENVLMERFDPVSVLPILAGTDLGFRVMSSEGQIILGGVEVSLDRHIGKRRHVMISALEFQSTFFDRYWLFSNAETAALKQLAAEMDVHLVSRVGIAQLVETGWEILMQPQDRSPPLNRRELLAEAVEVGRINGRRGPRGRLR